MVASLAKSVRSILLKNAFLWYSPSRLKSLTEFIINFFSQVAKRVVDKTLTLANNSQISHILNSENAFAFKASCHNKVFLIDIDMLIKVRYISWKLIQCICLLAQQLRVVFFCVSLRNSKFVFLSYLNTSTLSIHYVSKTSILLNAVFIY